MTAPNQQNRPPVKQSVNQYGINQFSETTEDQWRDQIDGQWKSKYDPVGDLFGGIRESIGAVIAAFQGNFGPIQDVVSGTISNFLEDIAALFGLVGNAQSSANTAQTTATEAISAATAANNTVLALINGGTRTIYTSNFTYIPPANLVKLGVIEFGGGGSGLVGGSGTGPGAIGGTGGGYAYYEFTRAQLPASVDGIVGSGRNGGSNNTEPGISSFGSLASSPPGNAAGIQDPRGFIAATGSAPGNGGNAGSVADGTTSASGSVGGSSLLAAGGSSGSNGANAATNGQALAGGGGGGGGFSNRQFAANGGLGGAGGFPGGGGGGGGRSYVGPGTNGGPGAPGLIALIEFLA